VFHLRPVERWRKLLLPGIFPYLITGFVTASGGAWNASIVAEYFHFHGQTITTTGLGAVISRATDTGNFPTLLTATIASSGAPRIAAMRNRPDAPIKRTGRPYADHRCLGSRRALPYSADRGKKSVKAC
jgi:hypothetical protein